jgi:hypothetical protein
MEDALTAIDLHKPGESFSYQKITDTYNVNRVTSARRHQGLQASRAAKSSNQHKLNPQQEDELVVYINELTERGLPPTREMIQNFASEVAKERCSESWVTRFVNRHKDHLISRWIAGMDRVRHQADSAEKYKLYFDLLQKKTKEYDVKARHTYKMDEKGFMIGVTGRSKRVFSRRLWERKEVKKALQDGSRTWITLLATICADGTSLPPSLIFQSANESIRDTWVEGIKVRKHQVHVTSTPSGWSNNDVGLAWLEQVFNRYTKEKARRSWRLLIVDGNGSHLTKGFIKFCYQNRILLAILPPHSTHTLQPLDVVMVKPLSQSYSTPLTNHLHDAQGLALIRKGEFFPLFWIAWTSCFKEEHILKSFEATGIWPMNPDVILKRFTHESSDEEEEVDNDEEYDWQYMERLLRAAVQDTTSRAAKKLSLSLHHLQVRNELLKVENKGLREALKAKKKHAKHGKRLDLQQREECHGGATF